MNRIVWIDNAKAFAMFCVVFGHVNGLFSHNIVGFSCVNQFIVSFNMALFVFLSGYTSHEGLSKIVNSKILFKYWTKISKRILLPLIAATILHCFIVGEFALRGGPWFLKMIFKIYFVASFFCFIIKKKGGSIVVAYLLCFLVSFLFPDTGLVSEFFVIFILGALCNKYKLIKRLELLDFPQKALVISIFSLVYLFVIRYTQNYDFYKYGLHKLMSIGIPFIYIMRQVVALAAIIVIVSLIISVSNKYNLISKWGSDSLGIYVYHCLLLELYREKLNIFYDVNYGVWTWGVSLIVSIILWFLTLVIIKILKTSRFTKLIFLGELK